MKKTFLFTLGAFMTGVSIFSTSCNQIKDAVAKKQDPFHYSTQATLIIPKSSSTAYQTASAQARFDLDSAIKASNKDIDLSYAKFAKHIVITSLKATVLNGDPSNNLNNLTFSPTDFPVVLFNSTTNPATGIGFGGNSQTTPLTDPYNWDVPVILVNDILPYVDGKNWVYIFGYKLAKPTTKDVQVSLTANLEVQFN